ncbi:MAG: aldo/keto reductase, partial [Alphaproteobacteria bacterium]|nr:aldo/keto reductase [Alphaproteobacteria bacterium]
MPQIGFGTYKRAGAEALRELEEAIEVGYRHLDTAELYDNEEVVGQAVAESGVARSAFFITTKISPTSYAPGKMMGHAKTSLEKLRTDKVDLLLLHWP